MSDSEQPENIYDKVINNYRLHAAKRFEIYEQSAVSHCPYCLEYMPPAPGKVLDIGSGSGRDAAFFAEHGYEVLAIEPAHEFRELAQQKYDSNRIEWRDDRLPELSSLGDNAEEFCHVHLSAVLFHLPPSDTKHVLETAYRLLVKGGTVFIGMRIGPTEADRPMFNIDENWIIEQSKGLFTILNTHEKQDDFNRSDIRWFRMILKKI